MTRQVRIQFEKIEVLQPVGVLKFAKALPAKGRFFSAREQLRRDGKAESLGALSGNPTLVLCGHDLFVT